LLLAVWFLLVTWHVRMHVLMNRVPRLGKAKRLPMYQKYNLCTSQLRLFKGCSRMQATQHAIRQVHSKCG